MTQSGEETTTIRAILDLNIEQAKKQLKELSDNLSKSMSNAIGVAGARVFGGGKGANAEGEVNKPLTKAQQKQQDDRAKVRTAALQNMAKSFPGGGLMTTMAKSFASGGVIGGVATGITAVVGILTSIMKSSQVFQTLGGTIFKILGMMADLFLMPFVPLMMKFASWMISHMPQIEAWGKKAADFTEKVWNILSSIAGFFGIGKKKEEGPSFGERGKEAMKEGNYIKGLAMMATQDVLLDSITDITGAVKYLGGEINSSAASIARDVPRAYNAANTAIDFVVEQSTPGKGYQMGGRVPGGPGQSVQATLHGGEIVVPQDIAAGGMSLVVKLRLGFKGFNKKSWVQAVSWISGTMRCMGIVLYQQFGEILLG